ncbi:tetratricopeptide repeat protein [Micromonospora sp. DT231]|uniref:tetratricopeptide repeat protein n=1 Tax=Micromonospora sp. DT231 TaxID=3416526 RepID=UPI003CF914C5
MARHLVATGQLIDENPAEALAHALAARRLASRISAVREAVGLAAYHAGEWQSAIAELRTYHRMSGLQSHLAVLADCERALGRPERAIDLFRGADREKLDQAVAIELLIVAAGARGDLGQKDAAVAMLQVPDLTSEATVPWTARLRYAYADALLAVGRREEAREWFSRAADVDTEGETDAAERLLELDGVVIEGDDEDEAAEEIAAGPGTPGAVPAEPDADLTGGNDDDRDDEDDDDRDDDEDEDFDDDEDDDVEDHEDDDVEDDDEDEDFDDDEQDGAVGRPGDDEDSVDEDSVDEDEDRHPDEAGNDDADTAVDGGTTSGDTVNADETAPARGDESEPTQR